MATAMKSNLDLVKECDGFPYFHTDTPAYIQHLNTYYHLEVASHPGITLGYVLPSVALTLTHLLDWRVDAEDAPLPRRVILATGTDEPTRSAAIAKTTAAWRETRHFKVLEKWRNELYPVYGPDGDVLFSCERSASCLLGVVTYGVHMMCYERHGNDLKFWIPRRARTKQTYPGMLDNTVAGGMATGEEPFECLVRESDEEASLPSDYVRKHAKAAGCVTYFYVRDERAGGETGLLQPECQYIYDLDLTGSEIECKPNDDEVEGFEVMSVEEVKKALVGGEFKPNCALVMIDMFVRFGILTKETERDFTEICARLHRRLEFPMG